MWDADTGQLALLEESPFRKDIEMVADILASASDWVWGFLRDAPFRPREETLTEVLLTEFKRRDPARIRISKASSAREALDGFDWAWALQTGAGWLHMFVQAKQIDGKTTGIYPELRKAKAAVQAQNLIRAAAIHSAVPVFAFYNNEVAPFGAHGNHVTFGACARETLGRQPAFCGLPWTRGVSPMGVTVAHAQDVLDVVIPPPGKNQRAEQVNGIAMPWECLLCPTWAKSEVRQVAPPRLADVAASIGRRARRIQQRDEDSQLLADNEALDWLSSEPPAWARLMLEDRTPDRDVEAPPASFYMVVTAAAID